MTRQNTLENAFARTVVASSSKDVSTTPSLTTSATVTDNSSEVNEEPADHRDSRRQSSRARSTVASYKETLLAHKSPEKSASRDVSGVTTLVGIEGSSRDQLLEEGVKVLDEDWTVGLLPGASLDMFNSSGRAPQNKISGARSLLQKAASSFAKSKTSLGKRRRDDSNADPEEVAAIYGITSSRLRSRDPKPQPKEEHEPLAKKVKLEASAGNNTQKVTGNARRIMKKFKKPWLTQGLYVGQEREFDARFTESENRARFSKSKAVQSQRKPFMPLPMFGGQRILEHGRPFRLPFDVFSPLPPGQPKPDEWKKTQKNVFIGDAANVWKKSKPLEASTCICTPEIGCDENCFNRFMLYECDDTNCNIGKEHCTNRSFADLKERQKAGGKYNIGVEVLKTADRGYGIRANRTFNPHQIVVEYTGEIITQEECESRMRGRYKDAECYYLMDFDQSMILDATRGSIARFVNHSCSPNCRMIKWTVQGKPRMALFAGDKGIMTGDELTYDYNFNPYSIKNVQACRCGAENCRGVLGPRPKDKEIKEALEPIAAGGKRKIQQMVEDTVEGVKQAAKKRKLNVPVPASVKSAVQKTKDQVTGTKNGKGVPKKKKPLPIGWVYVEEMDEAPPPLVRSIFDVDPESLLRSSKRKSTKTETKNASRVKSEPKVIKDGPATKARGLVATARALLGSQDGGSSKQDPDHISQHKTPQVHEEEVEDLEDFQQPTKTKDTFRNKANSARKNVVRTVKGRTGAVSPGPSKSIRVIEDV